MIWTGVLAIVVFAPMLVETWISRRHERRLRAAGAVEPAGDVIGAMTVAYPGGFVLMLAEGIWRGGGAGWPLWGLAVFAAAKALKWWAMALLGEQWSFRVLVVPGAPMVTRGPYRWLRHPNYAGVIGELAGVMIGTGAWATGVLALAVFGWLLARRIRVETQAHLFRVAQTSATDLDPGAPPVV